MGLQVQLLPILSSGNYVQRLVMAKVVHDPFIVHTLITSHS